MITCRFLSLFGLALFSFAQNPEFSPGQGPGPGQHPPRPFGMVRVADANDDGAVSLAEWNTFVSSLTLNQNGEVDMDALFALLDAARSEQEAKRAAQGEDQPAHYGRRGGPESGAKQPPPRDGNSKGQAPHREGRRMPPPEGDARPPQPFDFNHDDRVTVEDFDDLFTLLDQNQDGVLDANEMPPPPPPPPRRAQKRDH